VVLIECNFLIATPINPFVIPKPVIIRHGALDTWQYFFVVAQQVTEFERSGMCSTCGYWKMEEKIGRGKIIRTLWIYDILYSLPNTHYNSLTNHF
jgi:hypothetical protein